MDQLLAQDLEIGKFSTETSELEVALLRSLIHTNKKFAA